MNIKKSIFTITALAMVSATALLAQQGRVSPHETTSAVIDGNRVTITYGRPFTKHPRTGEVRQIWGGVVPWDQPWRTGANEATLLVTQKPLVIDGTTIPAGAYTLYTIPSENGTSKLGFGKSLGGWGVPVDTANDQARVDMIKSELDEPVDQFTMAVAKNESGGGVIKLMWEATQFSVPFTVAE